MDIHSAKTASNKLLKFISDVNQSGKKFYNNNRKNLSAISGNCVTISDMIDNLLCNSEAVNHPIVDLSDSLNMAYRLNTFILSIQNADTKLYQSSIDRLKQLNKILSETVSNISSILYDDIETEDTNYEFFEPVKNADLGISDSALPIAEFEKPKSITKQDRKSAIQNYYNILTSLNNLPYESYCMLKDLLQRWFIVRFKQHDVKFRYNIKNLPEWVMYFVAVFGKAVEQGNHIQLSSEISDWIDDVKLNGSKYALPYKVFESIHKDATESCTTCGNLLWNMLFESGMNKFDSLQPSELYPNSDTFYYWSSKVNISALDEYVPYDESNLELYKKYNIV